MRTRLTTALSVAGLLALSACGGGDSGSEGGGAGGGESGGGTFVFGAAADPVSMDGAYVSDGESLRVIEQIFETLVDLEPGSTEVVPGLAEEWSASEDGTAWTFRLRDGVQFHDGTPFDAAAVCANFDRWYTFTGIQQSASVSYYWQTVFTGFETNESPDLGPSLYSSCEAPDPRTAVITLTSPSASFLAGLALPAFSIASPTALEEYGADDVSGTGEAPSFDGTYGTQHPTGTGPFRFESFEPNSSLVLARNEEYWGDKAKLDRLIFRPIPDGPARAQALQAGEIQGYDLVSPQDAANLEAAGFQLLERPAFNVGYVGFNQAVPPFDNAQFRQAIAHALNRDRLVQALYPEGSEVAKEFMPPELFGYADDVTEYPYDPDRARELLAASGNPNPTVRFHYPTNVSRPYLPDPTAVFQSFSADLEAVGITVEPVAAPWNPDYLAAVQDGQTAMYLFGWTGDFGDPDNFVGTFFRTPQPQWGFDNPELFTLLEQARTETDEAARTALYEQANQRIMDFLPGVPFVHTSPQLAFAPGVQGYVPSPVTLESFAPVTLGS